MPAISVVDSLPFLPKQEGQGRLIPSNSRTQLLAFVSILMP